MNLCEKHLRNCQQHEDMTDEERAAIICELAKSDSRSTSHYGIESGYGFDQYRLYINSES